MPILVFVQSGIKMYQRGYFRDSYNSSNLLWPFDLSWWQDVLEVLVGKEGKMSPEIISIRLTAESCPFGLLTSK
jgi:hypothetical protein